jgi:alanyl aminopeptidase
MVTAALAACGGPRTGGSAAPAPSDARPVAVVDAAPWAPASIEPPGLRLPRDLALAEVRATLAIDPRLTAFSGEIELVGALAAATPVLWLHAERLVVGRAELITAGGAVPLTVAATSMPDTIALHGAAPLPAGPATVRIAYVGTLDDIETFGAFRQQSGGDWYAFTQLEATGARRVFPCLDEPDRKVPWQLTLDVPTGMLAVSNQPEGQPVASPQGSGWHRFVFPPTRPLPSYLVAFGVGPLEAVPAGVSAGGAPLRIIVPRGRAAEATVAAELMAPMLSRQEAWFGMRLPYAKLDSLVIPITVGFGAMENPGLVTYAERLILMPADAPATRRRTLSWYAAHELAHMWFGDLVTPAFWDDLWLNESFATWASARFVDQLAPGWVGPDEAVAERDVALHADSLVSARRIRQPISDDADIGAAFDDITYEKGAAVLTMIEGWLGPDVMRQAVLAYLRAHADGNATAADFLRAATEASGKDVSAAMSTFLDQGGAPQVEAQLTCGGAAPTVTLSQRRYLPLGAGAAAGDPRWQLPLCLAYDAGGRRGEACALVTEARQALTLPDGAACPTWLYPNRGGTGYVRVAATAADWSALLGRGWASLTAGERLAVVQDLRAQVAAGTLGVDVLLGALPRLVAGGTEAGFDLVAAVLDELAPELTRSPALTGWVQKLLGPTGKRLGWVARGGGPALDDGVRRAVLPWLVELGGDRVARRHALRLADDPARIPQAVRGDVLVAAIRAEPARFDALLAAWRGATDKRLREELLGALGSVREPALLERALALSLDPALDVRTTVGAIEAALDDDATRPTAETFVMAHLGELRARMGEDGALDLIGWLAAGCDAAKVAPMQALAEAELGTAPGARRAIDQAFEAKRGCVAQRAARAAGLAAWQRSLR